MFHATCPLAHALHELMQDLADLALEYNAKASDIENAKDTKNPAYMEANGRVNAYCDAGRRLAKATGIDYIEPGA